MTVNYQESGIDLDYTYINANDVQYFPLEVLNITGRKVVTVGQNFQSTYPIGNLGTAFNLSNVNVPKLDLNNSDIVATLPTGAIYQNRDYPYQSQIRGQFNLLENTPQTDGWLVGYANHSSPVQIGDKRDWINVFTGDTTGVIDKQYNLWMCGYNRYSLAGTGISSPSYLSQAVPPVGYTMVASNLQNSYAIGKDGTLWSCGYGYSWLLGNNTSTYLGSVSSFIQIGTESNWSKVATTQPAGGVLGGARAIKNDGTLWVWGLNNNGQLGLSDTTIRSSPTQVGSLSTWVQVACGYNTTTAIQSNGTLWSWGGVFSPVQVGIGSNWAKISCGDATFLAIQSDGTLWAWGNNNTGQLGLSDAVNRTTPVQVGVSTNWVQVSAGNNNTAAIKSDGTAWVWGYNVNGQLGLSDTTTRYSPVQLGSSSDWVKISVGARNGYTMGVKSDGTLWAIGGYNADGRLGNIEDGTRVSKLNYGL